MELEKIIELIHTVSESNLTQFTMEEGNLKISMKTDKQTKVIAAPQAAAAVPAAMVTEKKSEDGSRETSPGLSSDQESDELFNVCHDGYRIDLGSVLADSHDFLLDDLKYGQYC